jgi:hypothetical protein
MKTRFLSSRAFIALCLVLMAVGPMNVVGRAFSSGPPAGYTGAPGEANCTLCHSSFLVNTGSAGFGVTVPQTFVPSTAHSVNVAFSGSSNPRHGFEITARDGAGVASGGWQVVQIGLTKNAFGSTVHHEHTSLGNAQSAWVMNWLAPASLPNGPVTFYAAGNQSNMDFTPGGDYIYTAAAKMYQATLSTPSTTWPMAVPNPITLVAPNHGNELYFIVPSVNPTPVSFGGPFLLEVTPDFAFLAFVYSTPQFFQNLNANLDAGGQATGTVTIPFYPPLSGFTLHFAGITADPQLNPTEVSNRVTITIQ